MTENDNKGRLGLCHGSQSSSDKLRTDALVLKLREHGHRGEPHALKVALFSLDDDGCEEDMTHDPVFGVSDQGDGVWTGLAQLIDQVRLFVAAKGLPVDLPVCCLSPRASFLILIMGDGSSDNHGPKETLLDNYAAASFEDPL